MSASPVLRVEKSQGVATLTLDRPEAMNALSAELRRALTHAFRELQADDDVRVAIVTGAGRAFCAGLDLKELSETGLDQSGDLDGAAVVDASSGPSTVTPSPEASSSRWRAMCSWPPPRPSSPIPTSGSESCRGGD